MVSDRVRSRYDCQIFDAPVGGQETVIRLQVLRFLCRNEDCGNKTFAEQVPGLTTRYGRYRLALRESLRGIALALGGRAPDSPSAWQRRSTG